jgi:DNA-binding MarR family transcriptional regulator
VPPLFPGGRLVGDPHRDVDLKIAGALERLSQAVRVLLQDAAQDYGLSPTQIHILVRLGTRGDLGRVGWLADEFNLSQPTISDAVAALESKGLVAKRRASTDGRAYTIVVTAAGTGVIRRLGTWNRALRDAVEEAADEDKPAVMRFLFGIIAALQEQGVITVARMCITCRYFERSRSAKKPHYCGLLRMPLPETELRIDCPEHAVAI